MSTRFDTARRLGYTDESFSIAPGKQRFVDWMAAEAEDWFARGLGLRGQGDLGHADAGHDLIFRGWRIDVKWAQTTPGQRWKREPLARRNYPGLTYTQGRPFRSDIYVVVFGPDSPLDFEKWRWADGWATVDEIKAAPVVKGKKRKTSGADTFYHFIGFDYLHPIWDLLDIHDR